MLSRSLSLIAAISLLAACSTPAPVKPQNLQRSDYRYTEQYLSWLIDKEMNDNDVTGLSIALVDDQQMVWSAGFGYSDAENKIRATAATPYRMGSIAKLLTATATMQLAERGQMDIDQPLSRYLPEFSIKSRFASTEPITPRNIMTHHSGLPSNYLSGMLAENPRYFTTLVNDVRDEYVAYPPNYVFAYSNLAVTLLGAAIERTTGQAYPQYVAQNLFRPLGMDHSYYSSQPGLKGYTKGKLSEYLPLRDLPSGGLVSNVEDLSRFMEMMFAGGRMNGQQVIRSETIAEMLRPQNSNVPLDVGIHMGLGWMLDRSEIHGGGFVAGHGGALHNFHSELRIMPAHKLGVIVAANSSSGHSVVAKVASEALRLMLEAKTGLSEPEKFEAAPASIATEPIPRGFYDTFFGVIKVDGKENADLMGYSFSLTPGEHGWYGAKYNLLGFIPVSFSPLDTVHLAMTRIADHDVLVANMGDETKLVGEKLSPPAMRDALLPYVGKYEIINNGMGVTPTSLALQYEDGMFVGVCTFSQMPGIVMRVSIAPISEHEAIVSGLGPSRGETMRMFEAGSEKHIVFSGMELRKTN